MTVHKTRHRSESKTLELIVLARVTLVAGKHRLRNLLEPLTVDDLRDLLDWAMMDSIAYKLFAVSQRLITSLPPLLRR